jgi:hypothetical protein
MNIFEVASRAAFRFATPAGHLSVEDLWDLPLQSRAGKANLDDIAKSLHRELKQSADDISFVAEKNADNSDTQIKFDVVKRVIEVRLEEKKARDEAADRASKKQHLLELIAKKEDQRVADLPIEELKKMVENL